MANRILNWAKRPFGEERYSPHPIDLREVLGAERFSRRRTDMPEVFGVEVWDKGIRSIGRGEIGNWSTEDNPVQKLRGEMEQQYAARELKEPMVFLSHRRSDSKRAKLLAEQIVDNTNCDVWLDVWNPTLAALSERASSSAGQTQLIAMTIDMGLLNSTHLVALYTADAAGSSWIPYEYGRVKPKTPFSVKVAARISRGVVFPEYMELGMKFDSDHAVIDWLP